MLIVKKIMYEIRKNLLQFQINLNLKFKLPTTHSFCNDQKSIPITTILHLCLNEDAKIHHIIIVPSIERINVRRD